MTRLLTTLLVLFLSHSLSAATCSDEVTISFEQAEFNDFLTGTTEKTEVAKKRRYVREGLVGQIKNFALQEKLQRGNTTICKYKYKRADIDLEIRFTPKFLKVTMEKEYSTKSDDRDLFIYDNTLLMFEQFDRNNNPPKAPNGMRLLEMADVKMLNRFNYYYSCGFTDCTFGGDELTELAEFDQVTVLY